MFSSRRTCWRAFCGMLVRLSIFHSNETQCLVGRTVVLSCGTPSACPTSWEQPFLSSWPLPLGGNNRNFFVFLFPVVLIRFGNWTRLRFVAIECIEQLDFLLGSDSTTFWEPKSLQLHYLVPSFSRNSIHMNVCYSKSVQSFSGRICSSPLIPFSQGIFS